MNNGIKFDKVTGLYSFIALNGKVRSSPNKNYIIDKFHTHGAGSLASTPDYNGQKTDKPVFEEFNINERFDFIAKFVSMVSDKIQPAMIITGAGGLGKSHVVNKVLKAEGYTDVSNTENFVAGQHLPLKRYVSVKGYSTPKSLFRKLYENKDNVVIFDDCDNILQDPVAANILKSALDSNAERIISWNSESRDEDLPKSFRFTGGVVFISNLNKEKIPQALRTRAVCVDVSMTLVQKIDRMRLIAFEDDFLPDVDVTVKQDALDLIDLHKEQAREVSMRSLIQVIRIGQKFKGESFQKMARYALTN